jgi:hypothetical protein
MKNYNNGIKKRDKFDMRTCIATEEGLASVN